MNKKLDRILMREGQRDYRVTLFGAKETSFVAVFVTAAVCFQLQDRDIDKVPYTM
jgi:hypothetical protein